MLDRRSRELVRELAVQAGFTYDAPSCNLMTPAEDAFLNKEIWKFTELVLANAEAIRTEKD